MDCWLQRRQRRGWAVVVKKTATEGDTRAGTRDASASRVPGMVFSYFTNTNNYLRLNRRRTQTLASKPPHDYFNTKLAQRETRGQGLVRVPGLVHDYVSAKQRRGRHESRGSHALTTQTRSDSTYCYYVV